MRLLKLTEGIRNDGLQNWLVNLLCISTQTIHSFELSYCIGYNPDLVSNPVGWRKHTFTQRFLHED